ncbi:MAG: MTAP family purine nucleoside phosphorylase [Candidatus Firestonebacteria bacterium]|nr:MTAP family purine nucleoside phosphorylase [Candidatus Firestonebacteria bacterium]
MKIPKVEYAIIGGSSTFAINFPEDCEIENIKIIEKNLFFSTPFGISPGFKLFSINDKFVLTCKMHGWRTGTERGDASKQIFWVFREAGVKFILTEGGVGSINKNFSPRDLIIPHDYIDFSLRRSSRLTDNYLLIMRDPFCPDLRNALDKTVKHLLPDRKLFTNGVYCNTDGRHFESRAEIKMIAGWGADIVGQSICPEAYLAREIGACYAGIYMVVNYAEGIIKDWEHEELKDIFLNENKNIGNILLETLKETFLIEKKCECQNLRKTTLLQENKNGETYV